MDFQEIRDVLNIENTHQHTLSNHSDHVFMYRDEKLADSILCLPL